MPGTHDMAHRKSPKPVKSEPAYAPDDEITARMRPVIEVLEPEAEAPARVTNAGRQYVGDHKNHGEPEIDDTGGIEDINLDELPDSEGPDA